MHNPAVALLHGMMFDTEAQRHGYTMVMDFAGLSARELFRSEGECMAFACVDELSMVGLPVHANHVMHINIPNALKTMMKFIRLIFPKNLRQCT